MVFENTRKFFDWGRPMIATACLDCGHVELALRNVPATGVESEPLDLVEEYRKLASVLVTTSDQSAIAECRRLLDELRSQWQALHGDDSLHEAAFGHASESDGGPPNEP
jgi:hypothetical protein